MEDVSNEEIFGLIEENNRITNSKNWRSKLRRSATTQALKKTTANAELIMENDESLKGLVPVSYTHL